MTETWLETEINDQEYNIEQFNVDLISVGRGKGIATYYNHKFTHVKSVTAEGYSLTKMSSDKMDVFGIYKSNDGNARNIIMLLTSLITKQKTTIIGGDFNVCALKYPSNLITEELRKLKFEQIVTEATHIDGGLLDHIYIKQGEDTAYNWELEVSPKYYSDHDCTGITLWKN